MTHGDMVGLGPITLRGGAGDWWRSVGSMLRWHLTSMRLVMPVMVVVQVLVAAGLSVGISLFFVEISPRAGLYLGTGASIITLILVGLVIAPQLIAGEKEAGTYDFTWSLPVPRSAGVVAWLGLSAIVSLPAMAAALAVAAWRLDLTYDFSWRLCPAVAACLVCGTMIGYAVAHAIERTSITQLLSQVLAFGVLGFTPITYPPENLPPWLASLHEILPFFHMGVIVRDSLTSGLVTDVSVSYAIVAAWAVAASAVTAWVLGRRK